MGRKPMISRERLLTIAEEIVNADGPQALTVEALAKAAGISKGGVQYSFSSKDELITALVDRWTSQFDELVEDINTVGPIRFVRSYIAAMRTSASVIDAKRAGLMIAYMQNSQNRIHTANWYRSILARIGTSPEERSARTAFLALEGLFALRMWGADDGLDWEKELNEVEALLPLDSQIENV